MQIPCAGILITTTTRFDKRCRLQLLLKLKLPSSRRVVGCRVVRQRDHRPNIATSEKQIDRRTKWSSGGRPAEMKYTDGLKVA